jgi:hypothetical protein
VPVPFIFGAKKVGGFLFFCPLKQLADIANDSTNGVFPLEHGCLGSFLPSRVARCVGEKIAQNLAQPIICQY